MSINIDKICEILTALGTIGAVIVALWPQLSSIFRKRSVEIILINNMAENLCAPNYINSRNKIILGVKNGKITVEILVCVKNDKCQSCYFSDLVVVYKPIHKQDSFFSQKIKFNEIDDIDKKLSYVKIEPYSESRFEVKFEEVIDATQYSSAILKYTLAGKNNKIIFCIEDSKHAISKVRCSIF